MWSVPFRPSRRGLQPNYFNLAACRHNRYGVDKLISRLLCRCYTSVAGQKNQHSFWVFNAFPMGSDLLIARNHTVLNQAGALCLVFVC